MIFIIMQMMNSYLLLFSVETDSSIIYVIIISMLKVDGMKKILYKKGIMRVKRAKKDYGLIDVTGCNLKYHTW